MDLSEFSSWNYLIQIAILLVVILIANVIRRKIKFIRNSLLPSSVIAGIIIFLFKFIPAVSSFFDSSFMEVVTYHCLGLGFIALALKTGVKSKDKNKLAVMDTGLVTVNSYLVQGIIGLGLSLVLSVTIFKNLFYASGLLLPMGFGQGTGQALNIGAVFESLGFENGTSFGLTIAAFGFLIACIVGVIYMNILKKKGKLSIQEQRIANTKLDSNIYAEDEAPLNESIDKLTIQVAFILGIYLLTYLIILGLSTLSVNYLGNFGLKTIKPLLWGFNFLFGTAIAILVKKILAKLKEKKIVNHSYINNYMMNRLSGLFFDVMIVAGIAAIDWQNLKGLFFPLLIICTFGAIGTFIYVKYICKKIYPDYPYEAFFSMFGMLTGTASTGMILLREIDPNFETPAADNLVLQTLPAIVFGAPLLLLMSFAGQSYTNSLIVFGIIVVMFVAYNILLLRNFIFQKKKKKEVETTKE